MIVPTSSYQSLELEQIQQRPTSPLGMQTPSQIVCRGLAFPKREK
jgi:hypothetical protein